MTTDHRGKPLMSQTGAIPHLTRRAIMSRTREKVGRELAEMGEEGVEEMMTGGIPPSRIRNYDDRNY